MEVICNEESSLISNKFPKMASSEDENWEPDSTGVGGVEGFGGNSPHEDEESGGQDVDAVEVAVEGDESIVELTPRARGRAAGRYCFFLFLFWGRGFFIVFLQNNRPECCGNG